MPASYIAIFLHLPSFISHWCTFDYFQLSLYFYYIFVLFCNLVQLINFTLIFPFPPSFSFSLTLVTDFFFFSFNIKICFCFVSLYNIAIYYHVNVFACVFLYLFVCVQVCDVCLYIKHDYHPLSLSLN